uniref:Protein HID1 n=1 Tax=Timema genevievae TaxID=629358 RepID=A0A7R9JTE0_TIMGE|nr:unnamed protein product [Timema genevievae]
MGNADTKLNFRKAVVQLTSKTQPINASDDSFWDQFWAENVTNIQDVFTLVPAVEIRALREEAPSNLATLCYKAVEKMVKAVDNSCRTHHEQQTGRRATPTTSNRQVVRPTRLWTTVAAPTMSNRQVGEQPGCGQQLPHPPRATDSCHTHHEQQTGRRATRLWTTVAAPTMSNRQVGEQPGCGQQLPHPPRATDSLPGQSQEDEEEQSMPLAQSLINAICDLLFCPDFTVVSNRKSGPDKAEDLQCIDSCEYIWESGVGFAHSPPRYPLFDTNRTELLKLLLTCFSETMYQPPVDLHNAPNRWIQFFTCPENRHALPLFTSLLNTVCAYDPVGLGVPYNHIIFSDTLEPLVDTAMQILIVTLDHDTSSSLLADGEEGTTPDNLFINYLSRIHRDEDFFFVLHGFTRLLNNPLIQTYLPNSTKKVQFHQELLVFFWKMCDYNKKFLYYVLKSSDVLEILVPILYHLNDSRADQSRVGLMHIGVFILLLLSGERNFGVRLNKPYTATIPMDIPVFTGTHADLLITVFHKIITTGHQRLQPLFDCLLTILVNVSPYLKTLSMVASTKLLHLLEAFSTPWFLFSSPTNHHLVFFLLEIFNNIIQYQFDGNSNLVYTIIRKRQVFHSLANLPSDYGTITKSLTKQSRRHLPSTTVAENAPETPSMEGSRPALPAEPGTLKATLPDTPGIDKMTEKESAHPSAHQMCELASTPAVNGSVSSDVPLVPGTSEAGDTSLAEPQEPPRTKPSEYPIVRHLSGETECARGGALGAHLGLGSLLEEQTPSADYHEAIASSRTAVSPAYKDVLDEKIINCYQGLTDESEILKFLQHGTLVGLLPVPHPILIRKYQANCGTTTWFRTYMWGVIYLREDKTGRDSRDAKTAEDSREAKTGGDSRDAKTGEDSRDDKTEEDSGEVKTGGDSREAKTGGDPKEGKTGEDSREAKYGEDSREDKTGEDSGEDNNKEPSGFS